MLDTDTDLCAASHRAVFDLLGFVIQCLPRSSQLIGVAAPVYWDCTRLLRNSPLPPNLS